MQCSNFLLAASVPASLITSQLFFLRLHGCSPRISCADFPHSQRRFPCSSSSFQYSILSRYYVTAIVSARNLQRWTLLSPQPFQLMIMNGCLNVSVDFCVLAYFKRTCSEIQQIWTRIKYFQHSSMTVGLAVKDVSNVK